MPSRKLTKLRQYANQPTGATESTDITQLDTLCLFKLAIRSGLSFCPTIVKYSDGEWTNIKPNEHAIQQRVNYLVIN